MKQVLERTYLILKLVWTYVVFWRFSSLDEDYHTNLGYQYFNLYCYRKAISHLKKSEQKHGRRSPAHSKYNWLYIGYCYLNLGDYLNAVKYLEQYLVLKPDDHQTLAWLKFCYEILSDHDNAERTYLKALINPDCQPGIHFDYALFLTELERKEEALEQLKLAEEKADHLIDIKVIIAHRKYLAGQTEEAVRIVQEIIAESEGDASVGDFNSPEELYVFLSNLKRKRSDIAGAITILERAVARCPDGIWLMNELASSYADEGMKLNAAEHIIDKALRYSPDNSLFLDTKGWILFKQNRPTEALKFLQRSLELNPNNKEVRAHLETATARLAQSTH